MNDEIRGVLKVLLIDEAGEKQGEMPLVAALEAAQEAGLDLVEVAPHSDPPVCKIMDYGKFRFEEQKKKAETRKKAKRIELKEIKVRPNIDDHDFRTGNSTSRTTWCRFRFRSTPSRSFSATHSR